MRSVSAALNRVLLAFFGLLIVCASAWFLTSGLDAGHHLPGISVYLAATHDQIGAILSPRTHWLVPCGVLASALAFVAGLFLLLMQVPRRPAEFSAQAQRLRWRSAGYSLPRCPVASTLRARSGPARCRALYRLRYRFSEQALGSGGHERRAGLRGRVDRDRAPEAIERGRGYVSGNASQRLDVLVRLARSVSSTSTSKAVTGQPSPAITGTGTGA